MGRRTLWPRRRQGSARIHRALVKRTRSIAAESAQRWRKLRICSAIAAIRPATEERIRKIPELLFLSLPEPSSSPPRLREHPPAHIAFRIFPGERSGYKPSDGSGCKHKRCARSRQKPTNQDCRNENEHRQKVTGKYRRRAASDSKRRRRKAPEKRLRKAEGPHKVGLPGRKASGPMRGWPLKLFHKGESM